jgi:hypothetical protein
MVRVAVTKRDLVAEAGRRLRDYLDAVVRPRQATR